MKKQELIEKINEFEKKLIKLKKLANEPEQEERLWNVKEICKSKGHSFESLAMTSRLQLIAEYHNERDEKGDYWYDSMSKDTEVRGLESKDIEDVKSFFETPSFISEIINGSSQISVGVFYQHVFKFDKNASKQIIQKCIIDLFGEPMRPSTWRKSDVLKVLKKTAAYNHVTNVLDNDEEIPF